MAEIKGIAINGNVIKSDSSSGGSGEVDFKGRTIHTVERECMLSDIFKSTISDVYVQKNSVFGSTFLELGTSLLDGLFPKDILGYDQNWAFPKYIVEFKIFLNNTGDRNRCCSSGMCYAFNFEGYIDYYAEVPYTITTASSFNTYKNDIIVKVILKYVGDTKEDFWIAQGLHSER